MAESLTEEEAELLPLVREYPYGLTATKVQQLVDLRLITIPVGTQLPELTQLGLDVLLQESLRRLEAINKAAA